MKTNSHKDNASDLPELYIVLKRCNITKDEALRALREAKRYIRENGFEMANEMLERALSRLFIIAEDERFPLDERYDAFKTAERKTALVEANDTPGFLELLVSLMRRNLNKTDAYEMLREAAHLIQEKEFFPTNEAGEILGVLIIRSQLLRPYPFSDVGGVSTPEEFGEALGGISGPTVNAWRRQGKVIGFKDRRTRRYLYPNFQVVDGNVLNGIAECVSTFVEKGRGNHTPISSYELAGKLFSPLTSANGARERAIDHLRNGKPERAVQLLKTNLWRR